MSRHHPPGTGGQERRERHLPALVLSWLLLTVVALAVLSCTAGDASSTAPANTSVPVASLVPSPGAISATATAPQDLLSPEADVTPAARDTALASPLASPTSPLPSPEASPTAGTVAAACPPQILPGGAPVHGYRVVAAYPHDPGAFTQGLVYTESTLYEGTGLYNALSSLRRVDLETGAVLQIHTLRTDEFGEGIAVAGERILQLTWLNEHGFVYDRDSFALLDTFTYPTEGWGLTQDGTRFIMSDGTSTMHFWDLETLEETGQVLVHDAHGPVPCLNELEYVEGKVYANVWQTDYIAVIDPASGEITAWIDLAGLLETQGSYPSADVLNGIAHDVEGDRLFVTGKWWPWLFEIEPTGPPDRAFLPQVSG